MSRNFQDVAFAPGGEYLLTQPAEFGDHMRTYGLPSRRRTRTFRMTFYDHGGAAATGSRRVDTRDTRAVDRREALRRAARIAEARKELTGRHHSYLVSAVKS